MEVTTDIIPVDQIFFGNKNNLDFEAICIFAATGFFLDHDTYFKEQKALRPCRRYRLDNNVKRIVGEQPYFKWHYSPKERSFEVVLEEFIYLFETIIKEQGQGQKVILPLSGGLDSRTQAVAHYRTDIQTNAYSYAFEDGHDETAYGREIAGKCGFPFQSFKIPAGYLWRDIESLADILKCYSEFTHPRQMAVLSYYKKMGNMFSLGHWGDVLFDDMGVDNKLPFENQIDFIVKKTIKKGGLVLAKSLWEHWDLKGDFESYFRERITSLVKEIAIPNNANSQIRAFKSLYWAPRWTSVNLSVFKSAKPIKLPYYDSRMCEFICTVPEKYLAGRQIQIEYIKTCMPDLGKIRWQAQQPFNLYNYRFNKIPYNLPNRVRSKLKRNCKKNLYIQRNWELQFLGDHNDKFLRKWLFETQGFDHLIDKDIRMIFYKSFREDDPVFYSHPVSMLLTLALFSDQRFK